MSISLREPSDLHQAARDYAAAGIPVFPCIAGGKAPATKNGFKDATTDLEQIDRWWADDPDYNVAIEPEQAGWAVVDLDPPVGEESWRALAAQHGIPPDTREIRTPRGGRHLVFAGSLPASASKLGEKIDTRGRGSYVLVPPSYIREQGAFYQVAEDREIAVLPDWIAQEVGRARERAEAAVGELDLPANVERAKRLLADYVQQGHVAIEGKGGDDRTYQVCAEVLNFGLSEETALSIIGNHWNPNCIPPWDRDELAVKLANASQYAQNEVGAWAVPPGTDTFASALDKLKATIAPVARSRFCPMALGELPTELVEPSWLIPGLIQAKGVTQIVGRQKSFKTFLTLDMALSIAAGVECYDHTPAPAPVVYAVGENASALGLKHIPAWRLLHGRDDDFPFYMVSCVPKAMFAEETDELIQQIVKHGIKPSLVVIDTATRAMRGLDENSAKDMGLFSQTCDNIREALDCAVVVVRHTGKDRDRGGRGSNVFDGDVDGTLQVLRHEKTMAVEVRVEEMRNAAEREDPYTFEGKMMGASLVFQPTTPAAHKILTVAEDALDPRKVGAALAELKAYGVGHGVTSLVLASELSAPWAEENAEQRQQITESISRQLIKLSKGKLVAYCDKIGRDLIWSLPAVDA